MNKYGNKKIFAYDRWWDSQLELELYEHLRDLHNPDDITIQPSFTLQPAFTKHGEKRRPITYVADFRVGDVIFDAKGFKTPDFAIKRKMFDFFYPHLILSVLCKCPVKWQNKYGKWIELNDLIKERAKIKRNKTKAKKDINT